MSPKLCITVAVEDLTGRRVRHNCAVQCVVRRVMPIRRAGPPVPRGRGGAVCATVHELNLFLLHLRTVRLAVSD